jgi:peptidoglycan hydrolase-like protein with peptidoglycan-binding domain
MSDVSTGMAGTRASRAPHAANPPKAQRTLRTSGAQGIGGANAPCLEAGRSSGPRVTDLQVQLALWLEYRWDADANPASPANTIMSETGSFGAATLAAVKAFQLAVGLAPTGVADLATQNLLKLENSRWYAVFVKESHKVRFRVLVARAGTDGARIASLVNLLARLSQHGSLGGADWTALAHGLERAHGDWRYAEGLGKLLGGDEFRRLQPQERSAIVSCVTTRPDAETVDRVERLLRGAPACTARA